MCSGDCPSSHACAPSERDAWETGGAAFEQWMREHRHAHDGRWPSRLAFTLWAGETLQGLRLRPQPRRWRRAARVAGAGA